MPRLRRCRAARTGGSPSSPKSSREESSALRARSASGSGDGSLTIAQPVPLPHHHLPPFGDEEVDARAELDQAEVLAAAHGLAGLEVADDPARHEAGDL